MTKKALFISGGWDGHEPVETSEFISEQIKVFNIQSNIVNDLDVMTDLEYLKSFDVILPVWTMGQIDDNNWEIKNSKIGNLQEAIHSGVGLAGWHGGMTDAFRDNTNYQFLVGSQFVCHPGNFVDYEVNIIDKNHEIVDGIRDFKVFSEQYFLHIDPSINIIASTKFTKEYHQWIDGVELSLIHIWTLPTIYSV